MPKGHSLLESQVKDLADRVFKLEMEKIAAQPSEVAYEHRIAALERRIAQMNDAFSRGNLPSPLGHGSQWTQ
jgi:hypothetical protein